MIYEGPYQTPYIQEQIIVQPLFKTLITNIQSPMYLDRYLSMYVIPTHPWQRTAAACQVSDA